MLEYFQLLILLATINIVLCTDEQPHLSHAEREIKFIEYEKSLRDQMRPNSMADTILLIRKLEKAIESDPKDWDWKLRTTNSTPPPEHHVALEIDAAEELNRMEKYFRASQLNDTTVSPEQIKQLEDKIKDQTKLYRKTITKYEKPVLNYQRRRQQRRKLRQQIAQKLLGGSGGTSNLQVSVMQSLFVISVFQIYN